jgi:hypothetical protein
MALQKKGMNGFSDSQLHSHFKMKRILSIALLICYQSGFSQFNPQSKKVTEKFFPEIEIEINTPAFQKKKGFTNYEEMMTFIDKKVAESPEFISYVFIGESQKGKQIPMLRLTNSKSSLPKTKVWMQGGLHGNEPASTEGLLYLVDQLLAQASQTYPKENLLPPADQALANAPPANPLDHIILHIVPMANIDGYEKQDRYAANGLDLNRDQTKLMAPESVQLKQAFSDFSPAVALDFHEFRPYRRDFARMGDWGISSAFDVMFLYTGNLNVPKELRDFTEEEFVNPAKELVKKIGLTSYDYISTTDYHGETHFNLGATNPRSSATSYALSNCISTLIEVRGVGIKRSSFKRRVFTTYSIAQSYLQSTKEKAQQVSEMLNRVNKQPNSSVVVLSNRTVTAREIPVIDIGSNELIAYEVVVRSALNSTPKLKRPRPTAYILPPGNELVISKLKTLGITVMQLAEAQSIEVEAYIITKYKRESYPYEGIHPQNVETKVTTKTISFPAGSSVITLDQRKSNLSAVVLEPETNSGFVHFEVIKTKLGEELPIYRYMQKNELSGLKSESPNNE